MEDSLRMFLALGDAVIITDEQHRIIAVNHSYERITGYAQHEIAGKKAGIVRTPFTPRLSYDQMKEAIQDGKAWSGVFTNRKKNGQLWHSSITITPFVKEESTYFVGVFRELERLERGFYLDEERIEGIQGSLLRVLAVSCEIRDPGIEEHLLRVQKLTERLVIRHNELAGLKLSERKQAQIAHSSILHDIGKSAVPEGILYKPGPLASYERKIVEMHTQIGVDILDKVNVELDDTLFEHEFATAKNIILHHHERWDGSGYPYGLSGSQIPLEARIVSVVDVFDALTSKRPYKEKWSTDGALQYLKDKSGSQFDPAIVDSFLSLYEDDSLVENELQHHQMTVTSN
ncbi:HD domain-containing phosphohydrolase [Paenibacillus chungangensis]|uniref:HD domain-containing phosphohydrolase n=1 Tax=Paenibacillus chungangensis TaxID=696535 RepID=A0ABW3HSN3_9BACL